MKAFNLVDGRAIPRPRIQRDVIGVGQWVCRFGSIGGSGRSPEVAYMRWFEEYAKHAELPKRSIDVVLATVARAFHRRIKNAKA